MAKLVFVGLSITSSWGNGHATTYRALIKALARRGHSILFLERDVPWYACHRDLHQWPYCDIALYADVQDLERRFAPQIAIADAVLVGSFVPDGTAIGHWITDIATGPVAFYDIDTPVTLSALGRGDCQYLSAELIRRYDLYLSFTGGKALDDIADMGSPRAASLYCSVDPEIHAPTNEKHRWTMGYLGTYSADRQPALERLLFDTARRRGEELFAVAGAQYPEQLCWPGNVSHIAHLAPPAHAAFYSRQRFTLNLTRADMKAAGFSPSVRLFEAAACGVAIISDPWPGLETLFRIGEEILIAESTQDALDILEQYQPQHCAAIADAARRRVLSEHTAAHRAQELETLLHSSTFNAVSDHHHRRVLAT